jgi:hypothetical protein
MILLLLSAALVGIFWSLHDPEKYNPSWIFSTPPDKWEFWVKHEKNRRPSYNWKKWEAENAERLNNQTSPAGQ